MESRCYGEFCDWFHYLGTCARLTGGSLQLWDLAENKCLFSGYDDNVKRPMPELHVAEMVAYLGPAPQALRERDGDAADVFDEDGMSFFFLERALSRRLWVWVLIDMTRSNEDDQGHIRRLSRNPLTIP